MNSFADVAQHIGATSADGWDGGVVIPMRWGGGRGFLQPTYGDVAPIFHTPGLLGDPIRPSDRIGQPPPSTERTARRPGRSPGCLPQRGRRRGWSHAQRPTERVVKGIRLTGPTAQGREEPRLVVTCGRRWFAIRPYGRHPVFTDLLLAERFFLASEPAGRGVWICTLLPAKNPSAQGSVSPRSLDSPSSKRTG